MRETTLATGLSSLMAPASWISTTLPGKSPGRGYFVLRTLSASSMLVFGLGGGEEGCWARALRERFPSQNPMPAAPPIFKKSRLSRLPLTSSERYPLLLIVFLLLILYRPVNSCARKKSAAVKRTEETASEAQSEVRPGWRCLLRPKRWKAFGRGGGVRGATSPRRNHRRWPFGRAAASALSVDERPSPSVKRREGRPMSTPG